MKPIEFPEMNSVYAKGSKRFAELPAHTTGGGHVITCWKPTFFERLRILFGGKIYCAQLTDKKGLQPQMLTVNRLGLFTYTGKNRPLEAKILDGVATVLGWIGIKIRKSSEIPVRRTASARSVSNDKK